MPLTKSKKVSDTSREEHPSVRFNKGVHSFELYLDKLDLPLSSYGKSTLRDILDKNYFDISKSRRKKIKPNQYYVLNIGTQEPHIISHRFKSKISANRLAKSLNKKNLGWFIVIKGIEALLFDVKYVNYQHINHLTEKIIFAPKKKIKKIKKVVEEKIEIPKKGKHYLSYEARYDKISLLVKRNIKRVTHKNPTGHSTTTFRGLQNLHRIVLEQYYKNTLIYTAPTNTIDRNRLSYLMFKYEELNKVIMSWALYKAFREILPDMLYPFITSVEYFKANEKTLMSLNGSLTENKIRRLLAYRHNLPQSRVDKEFELRGFVRFVEYHGFQEHLSYIISVDRFMGKPKWIYPFPFKFDIFDIGDSYSFSNDDPMIYEAQSIIGIPGFTAIIQASKNIFVKTKPETKKSKRRK